MGIRTGIALLLAAAAFEAGAPARSPLFTPAPGSPIPVGRGPTGVATADLDGDGKLDLVVAGTGGVAVLRGDGRGRFRSVPNSPLATPVPPHLVAAGDMNGDGRPDLVATGHDSHGVFVWIGRGDGRFEAAPGSPFPALAAGKPHNHGLALGDLDGDGRLDVVTADDEAHAVVVLLGDGRGALRAAPRSPFPVGRAPYPLALGDVNGDGRTDVVVPNVGSASVSVLLGDGRGGLTPAPGTPTGVTARPYFVALADLDGDGRLDALTTHDDVSLVTGLLGDGRGGFRPAPGSPFDVGRRAWKAVAHDVDSDGKKDLVVAAGEAVIVLIGDGRGGFRPVPGSPLPAGRGAWSLAVGDFDGDGRADVATADNAADTVTVLLQRRSPGP